MNKILILGGTQMLGRSFVESIDSMGLYDITIANRGQTNNELFQHVKHIRIDRDHTEQCHSLSGMNYDTVVDFSCYNTDQFKNTLKYIVCNRYILISTQSVLDTKTIESNNYNDPYFLYTINKKRIEDYINSNLFDYPINIIRPCAVYGENDYTGRFENRNNVFYWKGSNTIANRESGCISINLFTEKLVKIFKSDTTNGITNTDIGP